MESKGKQLINPSLKDLEVLVGNWIVEISNASFLTNLSEKVQGQARFESIAEQNFMNMRMGNKAVGPPYSDCIIGRDDDLDLYVVLYTDDRKMSRIYQMGFEGRVWKQWRTAPGFSQRFEAEIAGDDDRIKGRWEKSFDGVKWEHDFDISYKRIK